MLPPVCLAICACVLAFAPHCIASRVAGLGSRRAVTFAAFSGFMHLALLVRGLDTHAWLPRKPGGRSYIACRCRQPQPAGTPRALGLLNKTLAAVRGCTPVACPLTTAFCLSCLSSAGVLFRFLPLNARAARSAPLACCRVTLCAG